MTISSGSIGVSVFFVLSGFLITYLLINEHKKNKRISIRNFYIRRTLRIWPLYFLVVLFSFAIYPGLKTLLGINNELGSDILYHLAFLSNFDLINIQNNYQGMDALIQNITWSVSIEEQFYIFWPLIMVFFSRKFWLLSMLAILIGSVWFRIYHQEDEILLYFHTLAILPDLCIGGIMAYAVNHSSAIKLFFKSSSSITHLLFMIISFFLVFFIEEIYELNYGMIWGRLLITVSFAFIIAAQALTVNNSPLNLGRYRTAKNWGKYTYGIYLLHPVAILVIDVSFRLIGIPLNNFYSLFTLGIISLLLTLFLSRLSYHYYESAFLKLKKKYTSEAPEKAREKAVVL